MTRSAMKTLEEIAIRLEDQAIEMARLRRALDVQFKRIAAMQVELDRLPQALQRQRDSQVRSAVRPFSTIYSTGR